VAEVILLDTNLLVYARMSPLPQHEAARTWLDSQLSAGVRIGIPWVTILGFVRIATNPRIFQQPDSVGDAWAQMQEWLSAATVWIPQPLQNHAAIFGDLLLNFGASGGNITTDVHLAALAVEHGLTLYTSDGDFARFPGLRRQNPLLNHDG
jgi:uncharacterized protein